MFIVAAIAICATTVPLLGGRLRELDSIRLRWTAALLAALAIQILIISVIPDRFLGVHAPLHLVSYGLAALFFVANRNLPGLWVVGVGGGLNLLVIAVNGGVMPAVEHATAPTAHAPGAFINSAPLADPRLAFLGDVFSLPETWPLTNVFSIGDVLIVLGTAVVLHRVCGSRLARLLPSRAVAGAAAAARRVV